MRWSSSSSSRTGRNVLNNPALDGLGAGRSALGARHLALGEVLGIGARALRQAGVADPAREAAWLWAGLTGEAAAHAWRNRGADLPVEVQSRFEALVRRRAAGEPLAYVIGSAAFRTIEVAVTRDTLIPRPETEGLVEQVLQWAAAERRVPSAERPPRPHGAHVLDIGTGTGCIALALAVEGAFTRIVATDVSGPALAVAAANRDRLAPAVPVEFRPGSLFTPLAPDERFEVIVSNPPYLAEAEFAALDRSVRDWEPAAALVGGPDGMAHVLALLDGAARHLARGGLLAIEVDSRRADDACAAARACGWTSARIEPDLFGRPRYLLA